VALRLRPDRLVVGEVRGAEAIHLLHALNTGHHGSLATVHANSATDALARLAALVTQAAPAWGAEAADALVRRAIHLVVHLERSADGVRRICDVHDVDQ
jgi:Flp pilus assembly CpaF family ATPase